MTHSCARLRPLHGSLEASRGQIVITRPKDLCVSYSSGSDL